MKTSGIDVIARIANNARIWQFIEKYKTLEFLYNHVKNKITSKLGNYNSIKYTYVSTTTHKTLGKIKIVFIKTKDNLIPIISTNVNLSDIEIINTYKKRWNIDDFQSLWKKEMTRFSLRNYIKQLRDKTYPELIMNISNVGYKLITK